WETDSKRSPELWQKLAALGVPGLLVPEAQGGLGMSESEGVLLHEEAGRAALAEPLVATSAVAVPLLRELGGALAAEWLPRIAAGDARVAVGHPALRFVEDAEGADLLLLPLGEDALHAVAPATARIVPQPANDPSRRIASVSFDASASTRVAQGAQARALLAGALDRGALACAAQALGACDRMLELSVAYTSQRKQFGKPIGSYQAVKHMLANAKVKLEYARPLVMRAAWSVAQGVPQRALHVSMAKLAACEAARFASRMALQCHGAIGYTWEQDLHLFMRRAESQSQAWGRAPFHLARVRAAILDGSLAIGPGATFQGGS
ncbi:MAG TPA: acyl-CoA dehydrogenase family protein, partial [Myxococcota bacterium]|nr:acyl-CoA dehydrogenase family protein [Myxococcota bacterium]